MREIAGRLIAPDHQLTVFENFRRHVRKRQITKKDMLPEWDLYCRNAVKMGFGFGKDKDGRIPLPGGGYIKNGVEWRPA